MSKYEQVVAVNKCMKQSAVVVSDQCDELTGMTTVTMGKPLYDALLALYQSAKAEVEAELN